MQLFRIFFQIKNDKFLFLFIGLKSLNSHTVIALCNTICLLLVFCCNNNPFQTKRAYEFLLEIVRERNLTENNFFDIISNETKSTQTSYQKKLSLAKELYELAIVRMNNLSNTKDKLALAHSRDSLLVECSSNQIDCNPSDFEWSFHRYRGNCFVFNSGRNATTGGELPLKRLKEAGQFAALQLEIFVGAESPLLLDKYTLTGFTGLKLFIGNNTFKTVYEDQQEILISSGSYTNIAVQRMLINQR